MAERSFPVQTPLQRLWSAILIRTVRQKEGAIKHLQKAGARMKQQRSIFLSAAHVLTAAAHLSTKAAALSAAPAGFQSAVKACLMEVESNIEIRSKRAGRSLCPFCFYYFYIKAN